MGKTTTKVASRERKPQYFPANLDAAAELAAAALKTAYSDFDRPAFHEPVNEPHWSFPALPEFQQWHLQIMEAVHKSTPEVKVGGPCLPVMDLIPNYTMNAYGKEVDLVLSEHGAYGANELGARLADTHFPGSGFEWEMKKRSIDDFNMASGALAHALVFMEHPHVVKKAVPFILLQSMGWDPVYYATLYTPRNFIHKNDWVASHVPPRRQAPRRA